MKKIIALSLGLLIFSVTYAQKINKELTSCKMKTMDGKVVDLKDVVKKGQVTVVVFWATWCAPCKKELINIDELYEDWQDDYGIEVIAISIDNARNAQKVKPYVNGKGWEFPVLIDVNSDSKPIFNYPTVPFSAIIDKNKRIVYTHNGYVEGDEYNMEKKIEELIAK
jgi:cytochrome c biogenesis protein CcmG/thiol:disulfide interchange protein DsbE